MFDETSFGRVCLRKIWPSSVSNLERFETKYDLKEHKENNFFVDLDGIMSSQRQTTTILNDNLALAKHKKKRPSLFQQKAGQFCQTSTLHGIGDWYRAETTQVKIFWTIFFLGAFGAAVYGCYAILEQYLEAPVVVSYFVTQPEGTLTIPDVIICPFNRFDKTFFEKHEIEQDLAQYIEFSFGQMAKHPVQGMANYKIMMELNRTGSLEPYHHKLNETLTRLNMTFNEFLDTSSIPCKDFIIHCTGINCCAGGSVMSGSGKCYRVYGINQTGSGYPFAMSIVITLPKHRYTFSPNNFIGDGVAIKLAEQGKGVDFDLTFIPVGTHAVMPLKATKYEFINDPPRYECSDDKSDTYSHMACLDACPWEVAQNKCGCSHPGASFPTKLPSCTTYELYTCLLSSSNFRPNLMEDCRKKCLPRCNYWQYAAQLSYTTFPSKDAENLTKSKDEWEKMKNSIILDVYYERFEYTVIKHYPAMTVHSFIANVGGQYSLWLGGSILTLIQVVVFFTQYLFNKCYITWSKTRERKTQKKSVNNTVVRLARESSGSSGWDMEEQQQPHKQLNNHKNVNDANSTLVEQQVNCSPINNTNGKGKEFLF